MMQQRPYQTAARHKLNQLLNNSRDPVYLAPCGTGKTWVAAALIRNRIQLGRRVYVLVPQVEIFDEWMRVLADIGLQPGYINDEGIRGRARQVYVCMTMSLVNLLPHIPESIYPDEIITDEMQHSLARSWEVVYRHFDTSCRIGLTATLYHGSLRSFEHLYTDVVQTITKSQAIAQGYITKPLLMVPELWAQDVPKNGDDYDTEEQARILGKPTIIGNVIDFYSRTFSGRPVIVPCATHHHAQQVTESFQAAGWKFEHLHSNLHPRARKRILHLVRKQLIHGICTVGIGIEGMSIPGLWGVLWLRRTLSPIIWTQFNGRAERILEGKEYYVCADFVGNSVLHGMPDRDLVWSLEQSDADPPKPDDGPVMVLCGVCGVMNAGINTHCHFCGAPLGIAADSHVQDRMPAYVDGKLVMVHSEEHHRAIEESIQEAKQSLDPDPVLPQELTPNDKLAIIQKGIFQGARRKLFEETVKDWLT